MKRWPIRLRVAGAFAVAMAVVLAGSGFLIYFRLESHLSVALDRGLRLRAQDLGALVAARGPSLTTSTGERLAEEGESYAQLVGVDGSEIDSTRSLGGASLLTAAQLRVALERPVFVDRDQVPGLDEKSRLLATPVAHGDDRFVLVVGASTEERVETLESLRNEFLIAGPLVLVLATAAGYLLAGVSLRPVEFMRRRAAEISAETPGERLPVPETGDEVERLGATLNEMLERLEAALQRERDFVADAGHELRTPLTLLRTELELALRHAGTADELRNAVRSSTGEVDRLAQLAEDLLLMARSDRGRIPLQLERHDLADIATTVVNRFAWRAQEAGREIESSIAPGVEVVCDRLRVEQALSNLVDNALRHGDGPVRLSAEVTGEGARLHVTDCGPGFPADFLPRAFERFARADQARTAGGVGLGLPIVQMIAVAHGGAAHVASRDSGADAWISLPLQGPDEPR